MGSCYGYSAVLVVLTVVLSRCGCTIHHPGGPFSPLKEMAVNFFLNDDHIGRSLQDTCPFNMTCDDGSTAVQNFNVSEANGCGPQGLDLSSIMIVPNVNITNCCNSHDNCYSTCGKEKKFCDDNFSECLRNTCQWVPPGDMESGQGRNQRQQNCYLVTKGFIIATRIFGCSVFSNAQDEACLCYSSSQSN